MVDDIEADERGEGESDDDSRGVDVKAELAMVGGGDGGFQGGTPNVLVQMWDGIGLRNTKPTLLRSYAWVLELTAKFEDVRLEQTDTGATARHVTTHATEGGGVVGLVHL